MSKPIRLKQDSLKNILQTITQPVKLCFQNFSNWTKQSLPNLGGGGCCTYVQTGLTSTLLLQRLKSLQGEMIL